MKFNTFFSISFFTLLLGSHAYPDNRGHCNRMADTLENKLQELLPSLQDAMNETTQNQVFANAINLINTYTQPSSPTLRHDVLHLCAMVNRPTTTRALKRQTLEPGSTTPILLLVLALESVDDYVNRVPVIGPAIEPTVREALVLLSDITIPVLQDLDGILPSATPTPDYPS